MLLKGIMANDLDGVKTNGSEEPLYDSFYLPQDFATNEEAEEYARSLDCDYEIESTEGDIV